MKKILILTGSIRKNGNSNALAEAFAKGARDVGHSVKTIESARLHIEGCKVCNQCYQNGKACTQEDDFNKVAPYVEDADVVVFATPIYWFSFPAKLKALIDKFYAFCVASKDVSEKSCVLLACGEAVDAVTPDGILLSYHLIADYLKWKNAGEICALGYSGAGEIIGARELDVAEQLGAHI